MVGNEQTNEGMKKTRIDIRATVFQKQLIEQAVALSNFKTTTDFLLWAAQLKAQEIIEEHNRVLAGRSDAEIFFDALVNPPAPNNKLAAAAKSYKNALSDDF